MNFRDDEIASLTPRQTDILAYLSNGYSNAEIGRFLHLSANTVKAHAARIYAQLKVSNRTEAAMLFRQQSETESEIKPFIMVELFKTVSDLPDIQQMASRLQSNVILALTKQRILQVTKNEPAPPHGKPEHSGYRLSGSLCLLNNSLEILVYLETWPAQILIWNTVIRQKGSNYQDLLEWSANAISASLFYNLCAEESRNLTMMAITERTIFQNLLVGLHKSTMRAVEASQEAIQIFEYVLTHAPCSITALCGKANAAYRSLMNNSTALQAEQLAIIKSCYQQLSVISQDCSETWIVYGLLAIIENQRNKAISAFQNALRIDPSLQQAYFLIGQMQTISGEYEKGQGMMEDGIALCPQFLYSGNNLSALGLSYYGLAQYEKALNAFSESLNLQSETLIGRLLYISCLVLTNQTEQAQIEAQKIQSRTTLSKQEIIERHGRLIDPSMLQRIAVSLDSVGISILNQKLPGS